MITTCNLCGTIRNETDVVHLAENHPNEMLSVMVDPKAEIAVIDPAPHTSDSTGGVVVRILVQPPNEVN